MIHQFEQLDKAICMFEKLIGDMKNENEKLRHDVEELKSVIEDRDLEILQLQEDVQKKTSSSDSEKAEIEGRIEGLLGRLRTILPEDKFEDTLI